MTVKVTTRGRIGLDAGAALDYLVANAIGMIQRRTGKGIDKEGGAFRPYSTSYAEALRRGGESTDVDLTVTDAYLAGLSERSRDIDAANRVARATIGPGTGTSESRRFAGGEAKKTGRRSPPHNVLGAILDEKFPHLGLTPEERKKLIAKALKIAIERGSR